MAAHTDPSNKTPAASHTYRNRKSRLNIKV